jgi:cytidine deaminase
LAVKVPLVLWTNLAALGYERFRMPTRISAADSRLHIDRLLDAATRVRELAYAPYSRFKVGAAVVSTSGAIYAGCNVENASYGLSLCAERAAIAAAVAAGDSEIAAVAVVTGSDSPTPPCGMCLQTLLEFADPKAPVILKTLRGRTKRYALRELMPHGFGPGYL